ncbi:hypothetical protein SDC9_83450 [bioreactor metagenome]|uniref:Uncharacterized protein n=1 Tax=bioreactor metagenome TaxID=1076179 RepID=A0A644Z7N1_9ZZZZ
MTISTFMDMEFNDEKHAKIDIIHNFGGHYYGQLYAIFNSQSRR